MTRTKGQAQEALDPLREFEMEQADALRRLRDRITRDRERDSQALRMAVIHGYEPQLAYSVQETSKYTGLSVSALYKEIKGHRIKAIMPNGQERGMVIPVTAVDEWLRENTR